MLLDRSSLAIQAQLADSIASPSAHAVRREQAVLLADALARLPADYREVFILRNLEQIPVDEIAARMDRSPNAIRKLWGRAMVALKQALEGLIMNTNRSLPPNGTSRGSEEDSEVVRILDAYLSGIEAGQPADPDKLLADHPALASQLRAYLELMQMAGRVAEDSGRCATSRRFRLADDVEPRFRSAAPGSIARAERRA